MSQLTVIICTHNPRQDYLTRTLDGLKAQTLPRTEWEFFIVDNLSNPPLEKSVDLSWHPHARIVVETELGIVNARARAMREFRTPLLVFLDDDNVLAPDYLERCVELFAQRPDLGAASGSLVAEYESPPPAWFAPYESWIAVRRVETSYWSNFLDGRSEPVTAGMCLRRPVTEGHLHEMTTNPIQRVLGSRGTTLMRGEDVAIAKSAIKLGYSVGQFAQLRAVHLIAKRRSDPAYLFSLYRHLCASGHLLSWTDHMGREPIRLSSRQIARSILHLIKGGQVRRRLIIEELRGYRLARKLAQEWTDKKGVFAVTETKNHA